MIQGGPGRTMCSNNAPGGSQEHFPGGVKSYGVGGCMGEKELLAAAKSPLRRGLTGYWEAGRRLQTSNCRDLGPPS